VDQKTFHVVSPPHIKTNDDFYHDNIAAHIASFCKMMLALEHKVYLYSAEDNTFPCTEHITVIDTAEQLRTLQTPSLLPINHEWHIHKAAFQLQNQRVIEEIKLRSKVTDTICLFGGEGHQSIVKNLEPITGVDFSTFQTPSASLYRLFPSYAWMHAVYGASQGHNEAANAEGFYFDGMIKYACDETELQFIQSHSDYYLFVGRQIPRNGFQIALDLKNDLNIQLVVLDHSQMVIPKEDYIKILANAKAIICPSQSIEPFGRAHIDAAMCGTPTISTDWGIYTETVKHKTTGFRCRDFGDYLQAIRELDTLDRSHIRSYALKNFSLQTTKYKYQAYFDQLHQLWTGGFYSKEPSEFNRYG
jgi:hypothetical protein